MRSLTPNEVRRGGAVTRVAYLGNFSVDFCTEVHVAASLKALGHEVVRLQEGEVRAVDVAASAEGCDLFLWTQTYGLAVNGGSIEEREAMLDDLRSAGIPSVGFHLDRWWGLGREDQVATEPFFTVDHLFTADGGHDEQWAAAGIRHLWSPPAVFHEETVGGRFRQQLVSDIAFVGSWRGGYHPEWTHRPELIAHLRQTWRRQLRLWPLQPHRPVRGAMLRDLYASVKVVVGDSCLVGGATHYWSDRIPETLGRGGFLLHPYVEGIEEHYTDGEHLRLWQTGDWAELDRLIAYYLEHDDERQAIARAGQAHVRAHHTYLNRMERVLDVVFPQLARFGPRGVNLVGQAVNS